jgi:hypothetical protein
VFQLSQFAGVVIWSNDLESVEILCRIYGLYSSPPTISVCKSCHIVYWVGSSLLDVWTLVVQLSQLARIVIWSTALEDAGCLDFSCPTICLLGL